MSDPESALRSRTGLMAAAITALLFTGLGTTLFLASRPGNSAKKQATAGETAKSKPAAADKAKPAVADKRDGEHPYPECEACLAWLRENNGDPSSIQVITWLYRKSEEHGPPIFRDVYGAKVFVRYDSSGPMEHWVSVSVKFRGRNDVGAMGVAIRDFNFKDGKMVTTSDRKE